MEAEVEQVKGREGIGDGFGEENFSMHLAMCRKISM